MNNIDSLALFCESNGIYTIEGNIRKRTLYVTGGGEIGIIQTDGRIRIPLEMVQNFINELQEIAEDYKYRINAEMVLNPKSNSRKGRKKLNIDDDAMILDMIKGMKMKDAAEKYKVSMSYVNKKKKEYKELGLI